MITPTYPGVYVEELPSSVHTIVGVGTSIAAFVGYARRGPLGVATRVQSFADFEATYGALTADSEMGYAVQQFFLNGGADAWIVRVASSDNPPKSSVVTIDSQAAPAPKPTPVPAKKAAVKPAGDPAAATPAAAGLLVVSAADPGMWGDSLVVDVDHGTRVPRAFNLTVSEVTIANGRPRAVVMEQFRDLVMDPGDPRYALAVVNAQSQLVNLALVNPKTVDPAQLPLATGTTGAPWAGGVLPAKLDGALTLTLGGGGTATVQGAALSAASPQELAASLQAQIRAQGAAWSGVTVTLAPAMDANGAPSYQLRVTSGSLNPAATIAVSDPLAQVLFGAAVVNVPAYPLGYAGGAVGALVSSAAGDDGGAPAAKDYVGDSFAKTGFHALEDVDLFNILCIPDTFRLASADAVTVAAMAGPYAASRRAMYVLDVPQGNDAPAQIQSWLAANATLRADNSVLYAPSVRVVDLLSATGEPRPAGPSGTMAGVWARTDATRGVWKAPAGTEAKLLGVLDLGARYNDAQNGQLNPLAINALRGDPVYGNVSWGARTLVGEDQAGSPWKYVPVRRTAYFLEESLYRGLKWAVFEPNDEPLWSSIRLNVGAFMHRLFLQGAFQGSTSKDAYFVRCDASTTSQDDINQGIVNVLVGFAPLKPAEFVILQISQIAGQIQT